MSVGPCWECEVRPAVHGLGLCDQCADAAGVLEDEMPTPEHEIQRQADLARQYQGLDERGRRAKAKPPASAPVPPLPEGAGVPDDYPRGHPLHPEYSPPKAEEPDEFTQLVRQALAKRAL